VQTAPPNEQFRNYLGEYLGNCACGREDSSLNSTLERAIGRWLRRVRAGDRHLACNDPGIGATPADILLQIPTGRAQGRSERNEIRNERIRSCPRQVDRYV
jgi:hypothetical protein